VQRERAMIDFIVDVAAVVVGIAVYKYVDEWRQDLIWRWKQRHESSSDPWKIGKIKLQICATNMFL